MYYVLCTTNMGKDLKYEGVVVNDRTTSKAALSAQIVFGIKNKNLIANPLIFTKLPIRSKNITVTFNYNKGTYLGSGRIFLETTGLFSQEDIDKLHEEVKTKHKLSDVVIFQILPG